MAAFASMLREDATHTMPLPGAPDYLVGRDAIVAAWGSVMAGSSAWGEFRVVATRANGRPALANYLRRPGRSQFEPLALDVLGIEDGLIAEVVSFPASIFPAFGLPPGL
jgi:RNA polymerase sigma-70 factor (ECF subfamily)